MNKRSIIFLILLLPSLVFAQQGADRYVFHSDFEEEVLTDFVAQKPITKINLQFIADASTDHKAIAQHKAFLTNWVSDLKSKQLKAKRQKQFLSWMFYKVHRKVLKDYQPFTSFHSTLSNGNYDCLSGTTLYAVLLNGLGYDFDIVETNYHIYLRVDLQEEGFVLLESTDPINGFIDNATEIETRLAQYYSDNTRQQTIENEYVFQASLNNQLGLDVLPGLHYYNESVEAFNASNILDAINLLQKAEIFYKSERTTEFGSVLAQALLSNNEITRDEKRAYLTKISGVKKSGDFASLN